MFKNVKCRKWWKAAGVRAVRTMAQAALGAIGTIAVFYEVDWKMIGGITVMAGITSILTSLGGLPECGEETENTESVGE